MSRREIAYAAGALALFVALRVALLGVRDPFYDELFTVWIVKRNVLDALRNDSGPPLYYWLLQLLGVTTVFGARIVSLVCAAFAAVAILAARRFGQERFLAVTVVAAYPPAVLLSVDARAYALCALFVTLGIIALRYDRPHLAAIAFALAGYSHYYGVLFFPTLLPRWRAFALAAALFIPGFFLAWSQPAEAMQWLASVRLNPLFALPHAGIYPDSLFRPAPSWAVAIALVLLALSVWRRRPGGAEPKSTLLFAVLPIALVLLAGLFGRPAYFPMRFESVIAVPLALWIASSGRRVAPLLLVLTGVAVTIAGIDDHASRPMDDYRIAAMVAREKAPPSMPVYASGYLYLETAAAVGDRVRAFPPDQAVHPGWRTRAAADPRALPRTPFVWAGERAAPELTAIRSRFATRVLYANDRALVLEARP